MGDAAKQMNFVSIPIETLSPDRELPCDLYLFINGHFVKFKHSGDSISSDKYDHLLLTKTTHLFTTSDDRSRFGSWAEKEEEESLKEIVARVGEENRDLVETTQDLKRDILGIFTKEITNKSVKATFDKATEVVKKVSETKEAHAALRRLIGYSRTLADHSVNVANLSVFLAIHLKYSNPSVLKNIYLGALYHDIGKTRIDPELTEDNNPAAYKKAFWAHPDLGKTLLLTKTDFGEDILRIVAEHHERNDGKGHPKGLSGNRIYDLTKVVSIANFFDEQIREGSGDLLDRQRAAIDEMQKDGGHRFDPKKLASCIEALKAGC